MDVFLAVLLEFEFLCCGWVGPMILNGFDTPLVYIKGFEWLDWQSWFWRFSLVKRQTWVIVDWRCLWLGMI